MIGWLSLDNRVFDGPAVVEFSLPPEARGTPLAFSLSELRGKSRPEVASCLQDRLSSLRLTPAPGQSSYVEVTFTLP